MNKLLKVKRRFGKESNKESINMLELHVDKPFNTSINVAKIDGKIIVLVQIL